MNTLPTQTWTAARVLSTYPETARVFFHLKTDCVGCVLGKFCTLEKIAKTYDLKLDLLMESIQKTAIPNQPKE